LRARQTAEIPATELNVPTPLETDGLAPLDAPTIWAERLTERTDDIILVGHLPYMSKLASTLLGGIAATHVIHFQMGGVVALTREEKLWSLRWMIVPTILP
jgi:phosphohistidine phosphatase